MEIPKFPSSILSFSLYFAAAAVCLCAHGALDIYENFYSVHLVFSVIQPQIHLSNRFAHMPAPTNPIYLLNDAYDIWYRISLKFNNWHFNLLKSGFLIWPHRQALWHATCELWIDYFFEMEYAFSLMKMHLILVCGFIEKYWQNQITMKCFKEHHRS